MQIEINFAEMGPSEEVRQHLEQEVGSALSRFGDRITRVEAHVRDVNGPKGGPGDKHCTLEARPAGYNPVTVEHAGDDLYGTITLAAEKLERALAKRLDRLEERG